MATAKQQHHPGATYENDFYSWALEQAALLRAGRLDRIDVENIAEEIEGLAKQEARELRNRYATLLAHLLKWEFQPGMRSYGWAGTIRRERREVTDLLTENPGLKPRRSELLARAYASALDTASGDTGLAPERFPEVCPYTLDQVMDPAFWPGGEELPERA